MKEAAEFAESTQILMNVSEFTDVSQATDTLISSVQAFGYTAETSMDVVDLLNTIGNNYAISTADLAQSLTKSSASLVAAGGDLAEAAALTATANKIIQDADSVGTALKTTSLRLRGTDVKVLEEEGLDSEGAVTSKSKLQSKVKALSGVDILTQTGEYKSTYEILVQIADVWESMNDMDQAALLELIAGKRNSSVVAAILQNPKELKKAFEDANNASGSALEENEKYLDSIQGKIDQFNNSVQTLWSNTLDSDMVKGIVALGTELIKIIDKLGLIPSLLIAIATISMIKNKMGPIAFLTEMSNMLRGLPQQIGNFIARFTGLTTATSAYTAETLAASVANGTLSASEAASIAAKNGLALATTNLTAAEAAEMLMKAGVTKADALAMVAKLGLTNSTQALSLADIEAAVSSGALTAAQGAQIASALGLTVTNTGLTASFTALWTAMWPVLAVMLAIGAVVGVFAILATGIDMAVTTVAELEERLSDLNSEISTLESEIDSLNSELKTTQDRMAELTAMPSLSFVEQEELDNLKTENAELERNLKLKGQLLEDAETRRHEEATKLIKQTWEEKKLFTDKKYAWATNGTIVEDNWWRGGISAETALKHAFAMSGKYSRLDKDKQRYDNGEYWKIAGSMVEDLVGTYLQGVVNMIPAVVVGGLPAIQAWPQAINEAWDVVSSVFDGFEGQSRGDGFWKSMSESWVESQQAEKDATIESINVVLDDMAKQIADYDLEYGINDTIDNFLDEYYAYQAKYFELKGVSTKADSIANIFNDTRNKSVQELKKSLESIANDNSLKTAEDKQTAALDLIDKALKDTSGQYDRLKNSMTILGVSADEMARYFVQLGSTMDSSTPDGIMQQYGVAKAALEKLKSGAINIDDLVKYDEDSGEAAGRVVEIAEQLEGVSPEVRQQFAAIVEDIKEGAYNTEAGLTNWDAAIRKLELQGMQEVLSLAQEELTTANKLAFPDLEVSGWMDSVEELSGAFESLASSMDLIVTAQEQMSSSGRISMKTALELMAATDDWNQILEVNNGVITMNAKAEQILIQSKLDLIKANIEMALQQVDTDIALMEGAINSTKAGNAFTQGFTKALTNAQGVLVGLKAGWDAFWAGEDVASAFNGAYSKTVDNLTPDESSLGELYAQRDKLQQQREMLNGVDTTQEFKDNYDFDKKPGDKYGTDEDSKTKEAMERFQREMDYWENRIAANQAKYEQLQNEIDLLEAKGQKADTLFYEEQIEFENERKWLLEQQKTQAQAFLSTLEEGSEEWF